MKYALTLLAVACALTAALPAACGTSSGDRQRPLVG